MNRHPDPAAVHRVVTRSGVAEVEVAVARSPYAVVLLGHGAGGDRTGRVLTDVAAALAVAGAVAVRFDQPYRVAGRRIPAPPGSLDGAAADVVGWLRRQWPDLPLVVGGRSSGARVACRVATSVGAAGAVALGFPLRPPARPERSRAEELRGAGVPVLVCQGERDAFGTPDDVRSVVSGLPGVTVHAVAGADHSFVARRADGRSTGECVDEVARVVRDWVRGQTAAT